ncbi:MAG: PHP domain-containing protein [Desulfobacca sp.]|uniref:PHP domain-containing protein n=1 Tax=Desulfobacca sp. TaxID=2067990 RepID=UPI00404BA0B0
MDIVDLHVHSTASDGSLTPRQVVAAAKAQGLRALALTDHDTIDGLAEALAAGRELGVEVIPGIEISAHHEPGSMHILGYFLDHRSPQLNEQLCILKQARADRNPQIIAKLQKLGLAITLTEVQEASGGGQVGRPHIAQVLVHKGYVATFQEAFERYIGNHGPAYVSKFRFPPREAIALIRAAGGVAALAHPFTLEYSSAGQLRQLLAQLVTWGLAAIEVYYPEHTPERQELYRALAREFGLLMTGGSDYHGAIKPDIKLGQVGSGVTLGYEVVEKLRRLAGQG